MPRGRRTGSIARYSAAELLDLGLAGFVVGGRIEPDGAPQQGLKTPRRQASCRFLVAGEHRQPDRRALLTRAARHALDWRQPSTKRLYAIQHTAAKKAIASFRKRGPPRRRKAPAALDHDL